MLAGQALDLYWMIMPARPAGGVAMRWAELGPPILLAGALCLVLAFPVAFAISFARDKWKPILLMIVILPFWINLLIRTYALIAVFRTRGHVNFGLEWMWEKANAGLIALGLQVARLVRR